MIFPLLVFVYHEILILCPVSLSLSFPVTVNRTGVLIVVVTVSLFAIGAGFAACVPTIMIFAALFTYVVSVCAVVIVEPNANVNPV